jgi:segregation and condensation protein A
VAPSPDGDTAGVVAEPADPAAFRVELDNFSGPFDLLLSLVSARRLDITEVSLSAVTDEFLSYLSGLGADDLDRASEFVVVAATLLDLKIAQLLPRGEVVDAEDVALLEARDLLFARLLQYRAFKQAAALLGSALEAEGRRHARTVRLEPRHRERAPELVWTVSPDDLAALAALALTPREPPTVGLGHLHAPAVSIREQAAVVLALLAGGEPRSFRELVSGVAERGVVVARFLAVLELYRHGALAFEQLEPLGELTLRLGGGAVGDDQLAALGADYEDAGDD